MPTPVRGAAASRSRSTSAYEPLKGLKPATKLQDPPASVGEMEKSFIEKVTGGVRIAMQFRSKNADEKPKSIEVYLMQGAFGGQKIATFDNVAKSVLKGSTVAEAEISLKANKHPGLKSGAQIGLWVKWPNGHDRRYGEAPQYTIKVP